MKKSKDIPARPIRNKEYFLEIRTRDAKNWVYIDDIPIRRSLIEREYVFKNHKP